MLLITRPLEKAKALAEVLHNHHIPTVISPVMDIEYLPLAFCDHPFAVIMTSAHAIPAFNHLSLNPQHVFLVGSKNQQGLIYEGPCHMSPHGYRGLLPLLKKYIDDHQYVLYLSGDHITFNFESFFKKNFNHILFKRILCYKAHAIKSLSEKAYEAFQANHIRGVTFFSRRSVDLFCHMAHSFRNHFSSYKAYCTSKAIGDVAKKHGFCSVYISPTPTLGDLIQLIRETYYDPL